MQHHVTWLCLMGDVFLICALPLYLFMVLFPRLTQLNSIHCGFTEPPCYLLHVSDDEDCSPTFLSPIRVYIFVHANLVDRQFRKPGQQVAGQNHSGLRASCEQHVHGRIDHFIHRPVATQSVESFENYSVRMHRRQNGIVRHLKNV